MANTVQHRRGNTVAINSHKGAEGEFVFNTATKRIHTMDGSTFGGYAHALLSDVDTKANSSVTITAGTGLTGGGSLAANRTIALSSTSIASLGKADTAVQPGSLSAVATSGAYSDLSGRPVAGQFIPSGGAAGQVLAKSSATNYDAAWVTSAAASAVSYAPQTLTPTQQGQAVANIGGSSLAGYRNKIINGNFDIWQRGVGPFGNNVFNADRWFLSGGTGSVNSIDRGSTSSSPIFGQSAYRLRWMRPTPGSGNSFLSQKIEDVRTLEGKKATLTFWASQTSGMPLSLTARQVFGTGGSSEVSFTIKPQFNLPSTANEWAKYSFSFDIPSVSGKTIGEGSYLEIRFVRPATGGLATAHFYLSRVSLVEGDATAEADPFSPRHIQQEMALCERYFQINGPLLAVLAPSANNMGSIAVVLGQPMRSNPTVVLRAGANILEVHTSSRAIHSLQSSIVSDRGGQIDFTCEAMTAAGRTGIVYAASFDFDAEL